MHVEGKRVLITGASSGIGEALARTLARRGASLFLVARREAKLQRLASELREEGLSAGWKSADVADRDQVRDAASQLFDMLGGIDVAILNAGIGGGQANREDLEARLVEETLNVNFMGVVNWLEHVLPHMVKQERGVIVGLSSLAAARGLPGLGGYSASKAALSTYLESLRLDVRPRGVQVLTVEPGFVRTEMTAVHDFPLPLAVSADYAARRIVRAIENDQSILRFPFLMRVAASVGRLLPVSVFDAVVGRVRPDRASGEE